MIGKNKANAGVASEYREVSAKPSIYTMLIVVVVVATPLGWLNQKIGAEGFRIADTTRFQNLVAVVGEDVKTVQRMLDNELVDKKELTGAMAPVDTLITPDIMPTNMGEAEQQEPSMFKIELNGIYWSVHDPIVTINDENYHTGEVIQGHTIIEIRRTEVVFEDPMGDRLVKYFYDYLDKPRKGKR